MGGETTVLGGWCWSSPSAQGPGEGWEGLRATEQLRLPQPPSHAACPPSQAFPCPGPTAAFLPNQANGLLWPWIQIRP